MINDLNKSLANTYHTIRDTPEELVELPASIQGEYHALRRCMERRDYFMEKRRTFNEEHPDNIAHAALFISFVRTCYDGIYSVDRKGGLSITFGMNSRARILEEKLIRCSHRLLQDVIILDGDCRQMEKYTGEKSFFCFDPPYKPVNEAGACTSYMSDDFDDDCQIELTGFCKGLRGGGSKWVLSNSDPCQKNPESTFFDNLYVNFHIQRLSIFRSVCSMTRKRETVNELLIRNC